MIYNDCKDLRIDDVSEVVFSGGTPNTRNEAYWNGKLKWLSSGETRNMFITDTVNTITELGAKESSTRMAKVGDIVIASAGQGFTRGQTSFCMIDTYINQSLIAIRCNSNIAHNLFVFYNLRNRYDELRQISDGHSIRGSLTTKIVKNLSIKLPNLKIQKAIANVLSSLDEKIDINNQIINNLEKLAQSLYKKWFLEFEFPNNNGDPYKSCAGEMVESELGQIPKGWSIKNLLNIANYMNGIAVKKFAAKEDEKSLPVLKIKELGYGDCTTESDRCNNSVPEKYIISKGDLIFSWSGTLLVDFWTGTKSILNQHLFKVTSSLYPRWFYYFWTEYHLEKFKNIAKGMATTLGHIKRTELEKSYVIVPDLKRLNKGTELLEPMIDQILLLRIQNNKLKKLRDELLPKLMNGEIEIPIEE